MSNGRAEGSVARTGRARSFGGSYANRICERWIAVRATTAFNKIVAPLGASVTEVTVEEDTVILSIRPRRRGLR